MGARRSFSRGGQTFEGGGQKKPVKGGPPYFFRQALNMHIGGGGGSEVGTKILINLFNLIVIHGHDVGSFHARRVFF